MSSTRTQSTGCGVNPHELPGKDAHDGVVAAGHRRVRSRRTCPAAASLLAGGVA